MDTRQKYVEALKMGADSIIARRDYWGRPTWPNNVALLRELAAAIENGQEASANIYTYGDGTKRILVDSCRESEDGDVRVLIIQLPEEK